MAGDITLLFGWTCGITFVLDYWQLQFDGPSITVLTDIEVNSKKSITRGGDDQFRNHLCSQIGKVIQCANVSSEAITITFVDQSLITISVKATIAAPRLPYYTAQMVR
jgi:hypothetical protein